MDYVDLVSPRFPSTDRNVYSPCYPRLKSQYLVHFPQVLEYQEGDELVKNPDGTLKTVDYPTFVEIWAEMEDILREGKAKSIGVSNFSIKKWVYAANLSCCPLILDPASKYS